MTDIEKENTVGTDEQTPPSEDAAPSKVKRQSPIGEAFDYFETFIYSACIVLILFSFFTHLCRVDGQSMEDTLHEDEMLLVSNIFYTPKQGDVIVFHQTGTGFNEPIVKRIIATSGQWLYISADDARLTITIYDENMENPVVLNEDYAKYTDSLNTSSIHDYPVQVPSGMLFVMGDNRNHSSDSRSQYIGFVDVRRVLGKVIWRVTPANKFGAVS